MAIYRGDLFTVLDKLCDSERQRVFDVADSLLRLGLVDAFDEFEGFKDFQSGRCVVRCVRHIHTPLERGPIPQEPILTKKAPTSSGGPVSEPGSQAGSDQQSEWNWIA